MINRRLQFCILIARVVFGSSETYSEVQTQVVQPRIFTNKFGHSQFETVVFKRNLSFSLEPNTRWRSTSYRSLIATGHGFIEDAHNETGSHWRLSSSAEPGGSENYMVERATISEHTGRITALIYLSDRAVIHIAPISPLSWTHVAHLHEPHSIVALHEGGVLIGKDSVRAPLGPIMQVSSPSHTKCSETQPRRFLQVLIVNDDSRYGMLTNSTLSQTNSIINIADGYFSAASFDMCIQIVLIGQLTFRDNTPSPIRFRPCNTMENGCVSCTRDGQCETSSTRADQFDSPTLLTSFRQWRIENEQALRQSFGSFDAVHLFSGREFDGSVKGLAFLDTICKDSRQAIGIVESKTKIPTYHAQIFAHELGHNLGLVHDERSGFIMSPSSSASAFSTVFSSRSLLTINSNNSTDCLTPFRELPAGVTCGNGFIDPGEECDPGLDTDDCCIECRIDRPRCACANSQRCCHHGQLRPEGHICRPEIDAQCDLIEQCTGFDAECPADQFLPATKTCEDSAGSRSNCYLGKCILSRDGQCSSANSVFAPAFSDSTSRLDVSARSCPTTRFCSRLHCRASSTDDTCPQLWSNAASDGSPCGSDGPMDSSRVCVAGYCVDALIASNKTFTCLSGDHICTDDDLTVLDFNHWLSLMTVFAVACIIVMLGCLSGVLCARERPRLILRPRLPVSHVVPS